MAAKKPTPKELVIVRIGETALLKVTPGSDDAKQWIESECPTYGNFQTPYGGGKDYTLIVADNYDVQEVIDYLNSYND